MYEPQSNLEQKVNHNTWTTSLPGYSCEAFPSRTNQSHLLLTKKEIRLNIWPEIPYNLSLWRKPAKQTVESLEYSKRYSLNSPKLLESPSNSMSKCEPWSSKIKRFLPGICLVFGINSWFLSPQPLLSP